MMRKLWYVLATAVVSIGVSGWAYNVGYSNSPGPYLPSEDSFDYRNNHCYPIEKEK